MLLRREKNTVKGGRGRQYPQGETERELTTNPILYLIKLDPGIETRVHSGGGEARHPCMHASQETGSNVGRKSV
jgi:hypothetical protein